MAKKKKKRFMIYQGNPLVAAFLKLLLVLLLFFLSRICFYLFNLNYFASLDAGALVKIFFIAGLRFDVSAILIINTPFILMNILPFPFRYNRIYQGVANAIFYIVNSIGLMVNFVDVVYFRFTLKRITGDIFSYLSVGGDFDKLLPQFLHDFWYLLILWIVFLFILIVFGARISVSGLKGKSRGKPVPDAIRQALFFLGVCFLLVVGIRGGFQRRPIGIITAGNYVTSKNVPLVLNTPFSIARTLGHESLPTLRFYKTEAGLDSIYTPVHKAEEGSMKKLNVMVIVMESFSSEHIGSLNHDLENGTYKGFTPFLDSLARHSLLLDGFANGKTSIQGIPAVLSAIPSFMNESYIQSIYSTDKINGLANLLKPEGYVTAFFHGGTNGTMGFDSYTRFCGFDHYFGRSEYHNEKDYDGKWGIRDEEFFQFTKKEIDQFQQPFIAAFFSLSSHHPYYVPEKYAGKFRKGKLPIQESIMYADYSLGKFFEAARKMPWYMNTLFVITADHTSEGYYPYYQTDAGQYAIPILFFRPGESLSGTTGEIAAQTDILPSVLDYLNYNRDYVAFGSSVFDSAAPHFSVHYISGLYSIVKEGHLLEFNGSRTLSFFDLKSDPLQKKNLVSENLPLMKKMEQFLKAYIQQYNNRVVENRLTAE
jgi:phosphoglycerol transferase MdoB-like AlkP superfamily enzyme